MKEETQDERMKRIMDDLKRCQENAKKNWPNGQKDYEEWYKLFRCE